MPRKPNFIRVSRILAATALGTSLVAAQALPTPLAEMGIDTDAGIGILAAFADDADVELTLVHGTNSTSYESFSDALAAAQDGDTIELGADAQLTAPLQTDKAITFDLKGHELVSNLGAQGISGALSYTGTGTLTLTSSESGGSWQVTVGSPQETSGTAGSYRAVSVTGGGTFALDNAKLQVAYTGASTTSNLPTPTLYGIAAESGSVVLQNGANLTATASETDGAYGANTVAGIFTSATNTGASVSVAADSEVHAVNNAECVPRGTWQVPDTSSDSQTYEQSPHLVQVFPDENSDFYKETCEKFKQKASFDDSEEASVTNASSTDTEVYYASPLTLDSGIAVWAYSEPQDNNTKGELDSIVPKYFFVQSNYVVATSAYGIESSSDFTGTVNVSGEIGATCANGNAYALDAQGTSTWTTSSDAKLSEEHGSSDNRVEYGLLNLESYFDPSSTSTISALGSTSSRVLYDATPTGGNARVGSSAQVTIAGEKQDATDTTVDLKNNGISLDDEKVAELWKAPDVTLSFTNMRDADGNASTTEEKTTFAKTLTDSGITLPTPAQSYTEGGTTYRFVGWMNNGTVYTADTLQNDVHINTDIAGASKGAATFAATYVAIGASQHLVQFDVDGRVLSYAVDDGTKPSYEAAGGTDSEPSKIAEKAGYEYEFEGWQLNGSTLEELPAATADVTYTASFKETPEKEELRFRYRDSDGLWKTTSGVTADYGSDANAVAEKYAKAGDVIKTSEQVYTFEGWGPRVTDKDALYADGELPAVLSTDSFSRQRNTYYAKYSTSNRMINVTFVVDGKVYAKTSEAVGTSTDFNDVFDSTGASVPKDKSKKKKFLGWSTKKNSKTVDIAKTNAAALSEVAPTDSDDLVLYAVFGTSSSSNSGVTRTDISVSLDAKAKRELSVDVSKASITAEELDNAKDLKLTISSTGNMDSTVTNNATRMGYQALVDASKNRALYEVHLTYVLNGKTQEVYDNFGTIKITAKVPKGARSDKVRAYWLGSSGINYSAAEQNKSKITFSVKSLGYVEDGVGNLEIALKSESSANLVPVTPSTVTPSAAKVSTPKPSAAVKIPKIDKSGKASKSSLPSLNKNGNNGNDTTSGDGADDASSTTGSVDTNQSGNIVGFAAMLALVAVLVARVIWFFVKRRRPDDDETEGEPMPDKETVSF